MCQDCDEPTKMSRCRVMSRTKGTFRCHMCHATRTTMYRSLGAGWGKPLKCIPRPVRTGLFQFAKETSSVDAIVESMTFMLERAQYWEQRFNNDGEFLPLGVWRTLGFDAAHIEKNSLPEDVMEHHVLGKVYRAQSLVISDGWAMGSSTRQAVTIGPTKRRRAMGPTAATSSAAPTEEEPIYDDIWSDSNPKHKNNKWSTKQALEFLQHCR